MKIGDKIFYPPHGAGYIEGEAFIDALSQGEDCFVFRLILDDLIIYFPKNKVGNSQIREVSSKEQLIDVIESLIGDQTEMEENWNKRKLENTNLIKTGDPYAIAQVIRNLSIRGKGRTIAPVDKQMLESAKLSLASEIMIVFDKDLEEALKVIEKKLRNKKTILTLEG